MATATVPDSQLEFDLGENEVATDISINEEGKAEVQEAAPESVEPASNREELETISDNVQKRIAKLTARMREAERREQAAIEYAKGLQTQTQTLQQKLVNTDYSRLNEAKTRLETQQATLKAIIRKAREEGDIDTETEAQQRLADLVYEQRQVAGWLQDQQQQVETYKQAPQPAQQTPQPQQAYQPPAPQQPRPSPQAEEWAERNPWFGQDRVMTYAAWGIHETLVSQEGIDPNSDEYYTELDRRLVEEFPNKFQNRSSAQQPTRQQRPAPAVAPATRSSGINNVRRTVRLSPSQVAIAKKLGVPIEEYAKYVKE
jgi:hypothetical protein